MRKAVGISFTVWVLSTLFWFKSFDLVPRSTSQTNYFATTIFIARPFSMYIGVISFLAMIGFITRSRKFSDGVLKYIQLFSLTTGVLWFILNYFLENTRVSWELLSLFGPLFLFLLLVLNGLLLFMSLVILAQKKKLNTLFFLNILVSAYPIFLFALFIFLISIGFGPPG